MASPRAIAGAIIEAYSVATIKERIDGHDKFQLAVARNALGILARDDEKGRFTDIYGDADDHDVSRMILAGDRTLADGDMLDALRIRALASIEVDSPKYPALAVARRTWTGEE